MRGACCSGLRAWNTDQCLLEVSSKDGVVKTAVCDVRGGSRSQHWSLDVPRGELRRGGTCATVDRKTALLAEKPCTVLRRSVGSRWRKLAEDLPLETRRASVGIFSWALYMEACIVYRDLF